MPFDREREYAAGRPSDQEAPFACRNPEGFLACYNNGYDPKKHSMAEHEADCRSRFC